MKCNTLTYTLKVWLTSVVFGPFSLTIIEFTAVNHQNLKADEVVSNSICLFIVCFITEFLFSIPAWLIFRAFVILILSLRIQRLLQMWMVFLTGILLAGGAFLTFTHLVGVSWRDDFFLILLVANTSSTGWAVWYYKLNLEK